MLMIHTNSLVITGITMKGIILINGLVFDTNRLLILLGHYVYFIKKIIKKLK